MPRPITPFNHTRSWLRVLGILPIMCAFALSTWRSALADEPPAAPSSVSARQQISADEFLTSPFAEFFKAGNYAKALDALDALAQQYPGDPLVTRYRAIVLDHLGRYSEAIALYKQLLARDPNHVPTHFFLAESYEQAGDAAAATSEWRWVIQNSPTPEYRAWAQQDLQRARTHVAAQPLERKRAYLFGTIGMEYDSNPLLKPNDKNLATQGDEKQADRYSFDLGFGYRLVMRPDFRVDLVYTARQSLHDRGLDEVNFTSQELGLDLRKRVSAFNRDVILGARYDFLAGFLDGNLFSVANRATLSADVGITPRTQTHLYHRFTVANFGPDGSNPPQTSRDGFNYELGVTQYLYSADFRRYLFATEELDVAQTRGGNFTRRGLTSRIGAHTPLPVVKQTDFDVSGGMDFGKYPRFTSLSSADTRRREDTNWDLYTALTHHWTPRLATRLFYRYVNANNTNDFYQYDRHISGIQLLFLQNF